MLRLEEEILAFLMAVLTGLTIACIYSGIRCFRRIVPHGINWISVEDGLYWAGTSAYVFFRLYQANSGRIRWYFLVGLAAGVLVFVLLMRKVHKNY